MADATGYEPALTKLYQNLKRQEDAVAKTKDMIKAIKELEATHLRQAKK